jgi:hypothetical protein
METSPADTSKDFTLLQDLGSSFDKVKGLHESVGDEGHRVGCEESLPIHSLVPVAPVLDFHLSWHV